jgi:hypothetical protein
MISEQKCSYETTITENYKSDVLICSNIDDLLSEKKNNYFCFFMYKVSTRIDRKKREKCDYLRNEQKN